MLTIRRPKDEDVVRWLLETKKSQLTYDAPGITDHEHVPPGFDVDGQQTLLGYGEETYKFACSALRGWLMFPREMTAFYWPSQSIRVGEVVAVLFRAGPLWSLNPCRIVYVIDNNRPTDTVHRFGFAYGTLPGHLECGEERFAVSWDRADDSVRYELLAISRPDHTLTKLGYPYARFVQARFRRLSSLAMQGAVAASSQVACG